MGQNYWTAFAHLIAIFKNPRHHQTTYSFALNFVPYVTMVALLRGFRSFKVMDCIALIQVITLLLLAIITQLMLKTLEELVMSILRIPYQFLDTLKLRFYNHKTIIHTLKLRHHNY